MARFAVSGAAMALGIFRVTSLVYTITRMRCNVRSIIESVQYRGNVLLHPTAKRGTVHPLHPFAWFDAIPGELISLRSSPSFQKAALLIRVIIRLGNRVWPPVILLPWPEYPEPEAARCATFQFCMSRKRASPLAQDDHTIRALDGLAALRIAREPGCNRPCREVEFLSSETQ